MKGRRLAPDELKSWQRRLEEAMPPAAMLALVEELRAILRGHMMVQSGLTFIREAWVAGQFAQARRADAVRLWPGDRPDCELMFAKRRELFEIVEADQPGRRRSEEYRALVEKLEQGLAETTTLDEDWPRRAAMAPEMLDRAARSKSAKGYDLEIGLIIYLNLMEYGFASREVEAAMQPSTASAKDAFREVWVLWQQGAYPIWRGGEAVLKDTWPKRGIDEEDRWISGAEIFREAISDQRPYDAEIDGGDSSL